ncbi:isochorismatase family protein [Microbulbifer sp. SAOS-129_SWC]|uniref:isochorismatase family protein n=1 Tax=Microbulbifer sp. SAOS-129_SWC TaxID=3145235 RepID=UPI0032164282
MNTVLIAIDLQNSLLEAGPWQAAQVMERAVALVAAARASEAPVVFVKDRRVEPDGALDADLQVLPGDLVVEKSFCDTFLHTPLDQWLRDRGVTRLVVCGMQTDYCIDTSCRRAASLGYTVELVREAHTTFDHESLPAEQIIAHHNRILRNFPAGDGSVRTVPMDQVAFT